MGTLPSQDLVLSVQQAGAQVALRNSIDTASSGWSSEPSNTRDQMKQQQGPAWA